MKTKRSQIPGAPVLPRTAAAVAAAPATDHTTRAEAEAEAEFLKSGLAPPRLSTQLNSTRIRRREGLVLSAISGASAALLLRRFYEDPLWVVAALSGLSFVATFCLIRWLRQVFINARLKGVDLAKPDKVDLPESMGAVAAAVFLVATILFIPILFLPHMFSSDRPGGAALLAAAVPASGRLLRQFPLDRLASYLSAILSIQSTVLLGICDDLFDMQWRHKIFIPVVSSVPLLVVYHVCYGVTSIVLPIPLRPLAAAGAGATVELGWAYYVYMSLFNVFCTNSINILAGINGIEVLQSLAIAVLTMYNNALYLLPTTCPVTGLPVTHPAADAHRLSLYLLLPFTAVSVALFWHNKYPASVFVGDTYCYFSGTVFAVVGILGHFSKTLWLFFLPQAFNFVYSSPQIFGLLPCPRHRVPHFNRKTGLLEPSVFEIKEDDVRFAHPLSPLYALLRLLALVRVVRIETDKKTGRVVAASNLTILNLWLVWRGPLGEGRLAWELAAFQLVTGSIGLFARHRLSYLLFGGTVG